MPTKSVKSSKLRNLEFKRKLTKGESKKKLIIKESSTRKDASNKRLS